MTRRLAAILAADMVGYSRLMASDEAGTLARQKAHRRELIDPKIAEYGGRIVKTTGDGLLVEFQSVVDALSCAVTIQLAMPEREAAASEENRIKYRIGINLGDVIIDDDDIYGDGVNVAARLEALAEPGGICVSRTVVNHVKGKIASTFEDRGTQNVKNIPEAVHVFRVLMQPEAAGKATSASKPTVWRSSNAVVLATAVLALVAIGIAVSRPWSSGNQSSAIEQTQASQLNDVGIAVLAFKNFSNDPSQDYLAEAIAEDITTELSRFSNLLVISRESSFSFRDKELGAQQIGAELGVRFVLEGSVRKAEDRIRVNVQLIDTEQEGHVWAEKYDRDLTDVLIVQDEIVRSVVSTLGEKIWQSAAVAVQRKPLGSFDAYDLELKGLEALHKFTPENNQRAREYFNSAIASDPEYSQSYIGLAWTYLLDYIYQWTDSGSQVLDLAFQAAQDADKAGSSKDHVLRILARINNLRGNNEKALDQITSALEYNPNDGDLLVSKAMLLTFAGRSEEAVPWLEDAMARNPRDFPVWWASVAGSTYYMQRDYRRAISIINRLSKPSVRESRLLAASYAQLGEMNEAKRYVDKVLEVSPNFTLSAFVEKLPYGAERDAEHFLEGLRKAGFPD